MKTVSQRKRDEAGAIAVVFAITAVILFVIAGLVIDLGLARDTRRDSQNSADAAALAGAYALYPDGGFCAAVESAPPCYTDAVAVVKTYAQKNFDVPTTQWDSCTDPTPFWVPTGQTGSCISMTDNSLGTGKPLLPTKLRVKVPTRDVKTGFGTLAGVSNVPVASLARGSLSIGGTSPCGLCMLGDITHSFQNGNAVVSNTSVIANGTITTANNGGLTVTGGTISTEDPGSSGNFVPAAPTVTNTTFNDPFASQQLPGPGNNYFGIPPGLKSNICTDGPGYYVTPQFSFPCVMQPGLYVITGSFSPAGNSGNVVDATAGVSLYFTCGTSPSPTPCANGGQAGGSMSFTGNATMKIHAPSSGPMQGMAIVSDRNNTSDIEFKGNGEAGAVTGAIYVLNGTLGFRGNGAGAVDSLIVVRDLDFRGNNSTLNLTYTGGNNRQIFPYDPRLDQ
ncbi:MAG: TadE/TadG family type IV pilus assembly protein [Marmoricola sp.]